MSASRKSAFLQIRVSPRQKAMLRRRARAAGVDVSRYVLARAIPDAALRLQSLLNDLAKVSAPQPILAEFADMLVESSAAQFAAVEGLDVSGLDELHRALIAAMVEQAAELKRIAPPAWTGRIGPLREPYFGSELPSVRLHLLTRSPPPYRRRNIFVDASITDRV